jgi:hypothetical protein
MAVSPVSLQVAAGIRIQGLTETFLGVWLDQVDGMVWRSSEGKCGQTECFVEQGHS